MPPPFLREVVAASLRPTRDGPAWPQLPPGRTLFTHLGRGAATLACRALGLGAADEVLVPAYNCGAEIDAVRGAGPFVVPYRVDARAAVDAEDLRSRIGARTRAVYVIHYFGRPQVLRDVRAICRDRGLLLIEDCALGLFASDDEGPLGLRADAAVFSFRKTLRVPDGGALVLRRPWTDAAPRLLAPSRWLTARRTLGLLTPRSVRRRIRAAIAADAAVRPDMPAGYYFDATESGRSASRLALGLLRQVDPRRVACRRRANALHLLDALRGVRGVSPLFDDVPPGACPVEFPIVVDDRAEVLAELRRGGVDATAWWAGFHRGLPWPRFPEACALKRSVVALPVRHDLDARDMDFVAAVVRRAARRSSASAPAFAAART